MKKSFSKKIVAAVIEKIDLLSKQRIDLASREQCDVELETEIVFHSIDEQETVFIESYNPETRKVRISESSLGNSYELPVSKLSLEHQLELIDWLEDDVEFIV